MLIKTNLNASQKAVKKAYRLARIGDDGVTKAVGNYLTLGKKLPMATIMYKTDEMLESRQHLHNMRARGMFKSDDEFDASWEKMMKTISGLEAVDENFDALIDFDESFTKQYPKTIKKRMKIYLKRTKEALKKLDIENLTGKNNNR